ncbi:MAG: galactokinase [Anaerolineae bacterium]|nr:galactokinase [Anaerolineae bacterium]
MQAKVRSAFETRFAHQPAIIVRAPGRVNLLGGHTDYNEGYVLPVAVDRAAWVAAAAIDAREARVRALDLGGDAIFPLDVIPLSDGGWADYPRGVAWALQERGLKLTGMEAVLTSDVPVGAGLSSSAAVEMAFAYAWQQLSGFQLDRRDRSAERASAERSAEASRRSLALLCQRAENVYVGVNCGIMDQMTSALGAEGYALLLDCRTLEVEPVPLPADVAIVVADTGVRRRLATSEYNVRRVQCEQAVRTLREHLPGIRALRDVSLDDLKQLQTHLPEVIYRRALHVVTGQMRVLLAAKALRRGDLVTVGTLMKACHASLRDYYEVSSPELDRLTEAACEVVGCYGARLTGAGFGGCIVALVAADAVPDFEAHVSAIYEAAFSRRPVVYVCRSADGVKRADSLNI